VQLDSAPLLQVGFTVAVPGVPLPPKKFQVIPVPVPHPAPACATVHVPLNAPELTPSVTFGCVVQLPLVATASGTVHNPPGPPAV
jgi:hypothetical protein